MCGIGGFWDRTARLPEEAGERARRLLAAIAHRGPDGSGLWHSPDGRTNLVHARLAIIDLTETGRQPMSTADGRLTIVFNGEIYNYRELREELERAGEEFLGTSDTEVLLRLYAREGPGCLRRLDGMFALAIHDAARRELFLARDPLGEKPLYVAESPEGFAFASEVRGLVAARAVRSEPDWKALGLLLRQGSVPAPHTHLKGAKLMPAGGWMSVPLDGGDARAGLHWEMRFAPEGQAIRDRREAVARVSDALRTSVRRRMRADVPVAAFLSGGLDSSAVVALMRDAGAADLRTFTVHLPGSPADEAKKAEEVARMLGTRHTTVSLVRDGSDSWLESALGAMDVPSIDGANTWLVSRAVAAAGVKVVVSGLGGDELFFGYPSFRVVPRLARSVEPFAAAPALRSASRLLARSGGSLPALWPRASRLLDAIAAGGGVPAAWLAKRGLFSAGAVRALLPAGRAAEALEEDAIRRLEGLGVPHDVAPRRQVSFLEMSVYLRDQLLRDSDAMSMAHGLELRVPLIGREVVETASSVADSVLAEGGPKALLREAVGSLLPPEIGRGPKMGFSLDWRRLLPRGGPWRSLDSGLFRPGAAERVWEMWHRGQVGYAYPFALEVASRFFGDRT